MSKISEIIKGKTRITKQDIDAVIEEEDYYKLGTKMTACVLTLVNGHEVVGLSGVVDAKAYDITIGSRFAREKAEDEVWSILGAILQDSICDE